MSHRYGQPIAVTLTVDRQPKSFRWRNQRYPIAEVFSVWRLRDRWWEQPKIHGGHSDRTYYRVCCRGPAGEQVFDLSHDGVSDCWILDLAHD